MIKLILTFLLIPALCFSQLSLDGGYYYFDKKTDAVYENNPILNYFTRNIGLIDSVNGKSVIYVPVEKTFDKDVKGLFVENWLVQFETVFTGASGTEHDVELKSCKCQMVEIDFVNGTISKPKNYNNDDEDWARPVNLKEKTKQKDYENFEKRFSKIEERLREFIMKYHFVWLRVKQGSITIYRNENMWFIVTNQWNDFHIFNTKKDVDDFFELTKEYFIPDILMTRYKKDY